MTNELIVVPLSSGNADKSKNYEVDIKMVYTKVHGKVIRLNIRFILIAYEVNLITPWFYKLRKSH